MNTALISSLLKKFLPLVVGIAVTQGWIDQAFADKLPGIVDALIILLSCIPTILSSFKTHGAK